MDDPFVCGVGFFGSIDGGTAPYELSYSLRPVTTSERGRATAETADGTIDLGQFAVSQAGAFASPAGFTAALDVLNADYFVSVGVTDANGEELQLTDDFVAAVRTPCTPVTSKPTFSNLNPALPYPGPFTIAPPSGRTGTLSPAAGSPADPGAAAPSNPAVPASPPLATTGAQTPLLATISLLFLMIGGVLLVASRREDDAARS